MINYKDMTINSLLDNVSSKTPYYGGGATTAILGAMACSLALKQYNLTRNNQEDLKKHAEVLEECQPKFIEFANMDSLRFKEFSATWSLAGNLKKEIYDKRIQQHIKDCATVPLSVASTACDALESVLKIYENGNQNLKSDGYIATKYLITVAETSIENVNVNLENISDIKFVVDTKSKISYIRNALTDYYYRMLKIKMS